MSEHVHDDRVDVGRQCQIFRQCARAIPKLLKAGDRKRVEEAESFMLAGASLLVLAHANGQAQLPQDVANWLYMRLHQEAWRNGQRAQHGTPGHLPSAVEVIVKAFAASYVEWGPGGDDKKAKRKRRLQVADLFGVSENATRGWEPDRQVFDAVVAKVPPAGDLDTVLKLQLREYAQMFRAVKGLPPLEDSSKAG